MPKTVMSIKSTMRDHTIGLPAPENTVAFGIPNACTECHAEAAAQWAQLGLRSLLHAQTVGPGAEQGPHQDERLAGLRTELPQGR